MRLAFETVGRAQAVGAERESTLLSHAQIDAFLRSVEARAFRIAALSLRDRDEALDVVQDAMIRLVRRYAHRPEAEWPPLFHRILQNCIRDVQRRRSVRSRVLAFFGAVDADDFDPVLAAPAPPSANPAAAVATADAMTALEEALAALPARQREAFVLRNLEGLDVAGTAAAMGCTEGSVKTHYSRAVHRLRVLLRDHYGDEPQ
jgi:RNA polymerase sigma-70 factor (ECF subfamily)